MPKSTAPSKHEADARGRQSIGDRRWSERQSGKGTRSENAEVRSKKLKYAIREHTSENVEADQKRASAVLHALVELAKALLLPEYHLVAQILSSIMIMFAYKFSYVTIDRLVG